MTWSSELGTRMTFAPARQIFESWWHLVPDEPGIYCVLLDQGKEYNDRVQKWKFPTVAMHAGDMVLANVGSTTRMTLRRRINHHIFGDSRVSSLRRSIAALFGPAEMTPVGKPGAFNYHFGEGGEGWITDFLVEYGMFGWCGSTEPAKEEFELIRRYQPALNIKGLEGLPSAQRLLQLRRECSDAARP